MKRLIAIARGARAVLIDRPGWNPENRANLTALLGALESGPWRRAELEGRFELWLAGEPEPEAQ